jgi:hypothetical protein
MSLDIALIGDSYYDGVRVMPFKPMSEKDFERWVRQGSKCYE